MGLFISVPIAELAFVTAANVVVVAIAATTVVLSDRRVRRAQEMENFYKEKFRQAEQSSERARSENMTDQNDELGFLTPLEKIWGRRPEHLSEKCNSIGLVGRSGVGKSSLFNAFVGVGLERFCAPNDIQMHRRNFREAAVGAMETTKDALAYQIPNAGFSLVDNPGHGTVGFSSTTYIKTFGIGYFVHTVYVYSERLEHSDVSLLLNFIMYGVKFIVVRQKFVSDLKTFAENVFKDLNPNYFAALDGENPMNEFVEEKIKNNDFIQQCKGKLQDELTNNWKMLINDSPDPNVRGKRNYLGANFKFFCVDSKRPKAYDTAKILEYIFLSATTIV